MTEANSNSETMATGSASLDPSRLLGRLTSSGVLKETTHGITLDEGFATQVAGRKQDVEECSQGQRREQIKELADAAEQADVIAKAAVDDPEFLGWLFALSDALPQATTTTLIRSVPQLQQFGERPARSDGAPELFVPVRGDQVPTVTGMFPRSILYVWLDDCEECNLVKESFDEIFDQRPEGVELFAVYGPEWAELLHQEYDIKGGPVVAYMIRDEIDARMYGAKHGQIYEKELEELRKTPLP